MDNRKKITLIVALLILGVGAFWYISSKKTSPTISNDTPATRVEKLKEAKSAMLETSGYNECARQVAEKTALANSCVNDKLVARGYTDGIDCFEGNTDAHCQDVDRYNAQVDAEDACETANATGATDLTGEDCMKLLDKNYSL